MENDDQEHPTRLVVFALKSSAAARFIFFYAIPSRENVEKFRKVEIVWAYG